jgi:hypothetical protein
MATSKASSHHRPSSCPFRAPRRVSKLPRFWPPLAKLVTAGHHAHVESTAIVGRPSSAATAPHSSFEPPPSLPGTVAFSLLCATPPRLGSQPLPSSGRRRRAVPAAAACSHVARPHRAASGQAEPSHGCVWTHWCVRCPSPSSPALLQPDFSLLAGPPLLSVQRKEKRDRG